MIHHHDAGSQYTSIASTERLAEAGIDPSVGSVGDAYENALAETMTGLFKTELMKPRGPWWTVEQVEIATLEYVDWFNHRSLLSTCGDIPPVELEAAHYRQHAVLVEAGPKPVALQTSRGDSVSRGRGRADGDPRGVRRRIALDMGQAGLGLAFLPVQALTRRAKVARVDLRRPHPTPVSGSRALPTGPCRARAVRFARR